MDHKNLPIVDASVQKGKSNVPARMLTTHGIVTMSSNQIPVPVSAHVSTASRGPSKADLVANAQSYTTTHQSNNFRGVREAIRSQKKVVLHESLQSTSCVILILYRHCNCWNYMMEQTERCSSSHRELLLILKRISSNGEE